jgi:hypothetical protein
MLAPLWKRSVYLACLAAGTLTLVLSCSDARPLPQPVSADAGPDCEVGTSGCACDVITGCRTGLLCIASKCFPTEGGQGGVPNDSDVMRPPGYGGGTSSSADDAGATPPRDASTDAAAASDAAGGADTGAPVPDAAGVGDAS